MGKKTMKPLEYNESRPNIWAKTVTISRPATHQTIFLSENFDKIKLGFDPDSASLYFDGYTLHICFDDGAILTLEGFLMAAHLMGYDGIELIDGRTISAGHLLSSAKRSGLPQDRQTKLREPKLEEIMVSPDDFVTHRD